MKKKDKFDLSNVEMIDIDKNLIGIMHFEEIDKLFGKKVYVLNSLDDYSAINGSKALTYDSFLGHLKAQVNNKYGLEISAENSRFVFKNRKLIKKIN